MSTTTSLTLRALLKDAVTRTGLDVPGGDVTGLSPSAQALSVAALAHAEPERLVVTIVASDADVDRVTADVRFFLGAIEGLPDAAAERAVLPLPSHEVDPYRGLAPHLRVTSARARALHAAASGRGRVVIASAAAVLPRLGPPGELLALSCDLQPGLDLSPGDLAGLLALAGFTREDPVDAHGEFCLRGGILDVFPAGSPEPFRIEFIGDTIESIRRFDPSTQRSIGPVEQLAIVPMRDSFGTDERAPDATAVFDYFSQARQPLYVVAEPDEVRAAVEKLLDQVAASYEEVAAGRRAPAGRVTLPAPASLFLDWESVAPVVRAATRFEQLSLAEESSSESQGTAATGPRHVACQPAVEFRGRIEDWVAEIRRARERDETVLFLAETPGRAERIIEMARDYTLLAAPLGRTEDAHAAALLVGLGNLSRGFRLPEGRLVVYAETDVFEEERHGTERRRTQARAFLSDLRDLKVGDPVVHVDHGIGTFVGLKQISLNVGEHQEFMELRYAGDDKLFVPVERLDLIQKYTGAGHPTLDKLGGTTWERAKTRVKKAMRDMAEELLKLYAARKTVVGHAFAPDTHWQQEFEDAFPDQSHPRPVHGDCRHQARPRVTDAHGLPALWRRRVRQDRGRLARRLQGGDGRQAGRVSRADDRARLSTREDAPRALRGLPGTHRHGQPLPVQGRTETVAREPRGRQGRRHRRYSPALV